jgi:hypothetical protein
MQAPKLIREVELPRQRSNGAAVVLVAAMAMFTAVAASAFVVRVRMHATQCSRRAPQVAVEDREIVEVDVIGGSVSPVLAPTEPLDPFHAAIDAGDLEAALQAYLEAKPHDKAAWKVERDAVAHSYLTLQWDRLNEETNTGDCAAVSERLQRMSRLMPDGPIPADMAKCTDRRRR